MGTSLICSTQTTRAVYVSVEKAADWIEQVNAFYQAEERDTKIVPDDWLVIARENKTLLGVVRLCVEQGHHVLRSMQVHRVAQRQGIGSLLLATFEELTMREGIGQVYCMPYAHLEMFYQQIGFLKLSEEDELRAPDFLWKRLDKHRNRKPSKPVILMLRSTSPHTLGADLG